MHHVGHHYTAPHAYALPPGPHGHPAAAHVVVGVTPEQYSAMVVAMGMSHEMGLPPPGPPPPHPHTHHTSAPASRSVSDGGSGNGGSGGGESHHQQQQGQQQQQPAGPGGVAAPSPMHYLLAAVPYEEVKLAQPDYYEE
mmetsp:Transcript_10929/g.31697  ORF Transcript_10929/g.31697 Transcript_10929/m.31697 type:complete len:139 (+) Transcript_10929:121-537(+)